MKRILNIILVLLVTTVLAVGCSTATTGSGSNRVKILFSVSDASDAFRGSLAREAQSYADSNQIDLTVADCQGNIETQISQLKNAKAEGYTAIICSLVNTDTAGLAISVAEGIPIIFINRSTDPDLLENNKYIYVGSSENVAGSLQAEFLADYFKSKGLTSINAVIIEGEKGHPATAARTEAVKAGLKAAGLDVTYIFEDTANWKRSKADSMFTTFLTTNRKYDCVICNNDEMALGVIQSCVENGIDPSSIPIVGVDGTTDGCNAIVDKTMAFTVLQSATGQSKGAVEVAVALSNGKSIENIEYASDDKFIWVPFESINYDNVKNYLK